MRQMLILMLVVALLAMGSTSTEARVAYADSEIFAIDTVTAVDDPASSLPKATRLASIYPNPFNASAAIVFDLVTDSWVER